MDNYTFGPMLANDPAKLAVIHKAAFPQFFLSQLGERFLLEFYAGFLSDPTSVSVIARDTQGTPVGAVVGTTEPAGFFRRLLRRRFLGLVLASSVAAIQQPKAIARLLRGALYRGQVGDNPAPEGALLSSICTTPGAQGTGVGKTLLARWERQAARQGACKAHLSTDADNNPGANSFYNSSGWSVECEYNTREGRRMNLYTKELS